MSTFHSFEMSAIHGRFCHDNFADNGFATPLFLLSGLRSAQMTIGLRERESCLGNHVFVRFIRSIGCFFGIGWSGQHFLQAPPGLFSFVEDKFAYSISFCHDCLRFVTVSEMIYHLQVFSLFDILVGIALSHRPG